jgi:hypothetical protein
MIWIVRFVTVVIILLLIFWAVGFWRWVAMAVSFVVQPGGWERLLLLKLRWKLALLKSVARAIGETEAHITEIERR